MIYIYISYRLYDIAWPPLAKGGHGYSHYIVN